MTILRAEIADLCEVVTESKRRAFFESEAFLLHFGLIHDLELDVFTRRAGLSAVGKLSRIPRLWLKVKSLA